MKRILVGVDGSEGSRQALAWAIDHAAASGAVVRPAIVWQRTFDYGRDQYWPVDEAIAEDATRRLTAANATGAAASAGRTQSPTRTSTGASWPS